MGPPGLAMACFPGLGAGDKMRSGYDNLFSRTLQSMCTFLCGCDTSIKGHTNPPSSLLPLSPGDPVLGSLWASRDPPQREQRRRLRAAPGGTSGALPPRGRGASSALPKGPPGAGPPADVRPTLLAPDQLALECCCNLGPPAACWARGASTPSASRGPGAIFNSLSRLCEGGPSPLSGSGGAGGSPTAAFLPPALPRSTDTVSTGPHSDTGRDAASHAGAHRVHTRRAQGPAHKCTGQDAQGPRAHVGTIPPNSPQKPNPPGDAHKGQGTRAQVPSDHQPGVQGGPSGTATRARPGGPGGQRPPRSALLPGQLPHLPAAHWG